MFVTLERAMKVVLELASQNVIHEQSAEYYDVLTEVRDEQLAAIQTVEDFSPSFKLNHAVHIP